MLLAELVGASAAVAATRSRKAKVEVIAGLLRRLAPEEVPVAVTMLAGEFRQGRIGVGYAAAFGITATPAPVPSLEIVEVDQAVGDLAAISGPGSQERRRSRLGAVMEKATEEEQQFLRRLFTGELRQGALEGIVVEAVAAAFAVPPPAVRRALMLQADLGAVAAVAATGGLPALDRIGLRVLSPVKPMLATPAATLSEALAADSSVEWKLDGARIQVHRQGNQVRVFTRNLNDVTERLPEVVEVARSLPEPALVLDGEAMALRADGTPRSFQETMSRFGTEDRAFAEVPLYPFFFDVLHAAGEDLIDRTLRDRLASLDSLIPDRYRIPRIFTSDEREAQAFLESALQAGQEGVMVKALTSRYEAGRRGRSWRKIKPVHTYDLVVLAAEWGHGRREGFLSNIHLGARQGNGFLMVGKTFKGMTDDMLRWQTTRFLELEVERDRNTVYVRPEQVVEVGIDGVQASPRYPGGIALRFARVRRYRDDKDPSEADTLETLRMLLT
jgi:DNA ligase-1